MIQSTFQPMPRASGIEIMQSATPVEERPAATGQIAANPWKRAARSVLAVVVYVVLSIALAIAFLVNCIRMTVFVIFRSMASTISGVWRLRHWVRPTPAPKPAITKEPSASTSEPR